MIKITARALTKTNPHTINWSSKDYKTIVQILYQLLTNRGPPERIYNQRQVQNSKKEIYLNWEMDLI